MTEHYYGSWKIGEPVTDELKKSILSAVKQNLRLNEVGGLSCYAILNNGDRVIAYLCSVWIENPDPAQRRERLKVVADASPSPESFMEIGQYVFDELEKADGD